MKRSFLSRQVRKECRHEKRSGFTTLASRKGDRVYLFELRVVDEPVLLRDGR